MKHITLDFETYFDSEFTLKSMSMESYINDDRFEVLGLGVDVGDGHGPQWIPPDDVGAWLDRVDWGAATVTAFNAAFDCAILNWRYGKRPAFIYDPMLMARFLLNIHRRPSLSGLAKRFGLGEKGDALKLFEGRRGSGLFDDDKTALADYCKQDVALTTALMNRLVTDWSKSGFAGSFQEQCTIIDCVVRMFTEPVVAQDRGLLESHLKELAGERDEKLRFLTDNGLPTEQAVKFLRSDETLAQALAARGVEPPTKTSIKTGEVTYAMAKTDLPFLKLLDHDDPQVRALVDARLAVKSSIEETRTKQLIDVSERAEALPLEINYMGARTGRMSGGGGLNIQNFPGGGALRRSIVAPTDKLFVVCDAAQIEARVLAYLARQDDLIDAFADGEDVYCKFASRIYNREVTKADKEERFLGKTCILGLGFGMGAAKLKHGLAAGVMGGKMEVTLQEAERLVSLYRKTNHNIQRFWKFCDQVLLENMAAGKEGFFKTLAGTDEARIWYRRGRVIMPNGLSLWYDGLRKEGGGFRYETTNQKTMKPETVSIYGGKMVENLVQSMAAIIISGQLAKVHKRYKVAFAVHDEIVVACESGEADEAKAFMLECMSTPPSWAAGLPLAAEAHVAKRYGDAK